MQDRGESTLTAVRSLLSECLHYVLKHAAAVGQQHVTPKMKAVQKRRGGGLMRSLNKQLSAASKNVSAEQCSWLRPSIFTQQRANRGGTSKGAAVLFSEVQVCDVLTVIPVAPWVLLWKKLSFQAFWHFCAFYIIFKVKFHFSNVKKNHFIVKLTVPFSVRGE